MSKRFNTIDDVAEWMFPNMSRRSSNPPDDDEYMDYLSRMYEFEVVRSPESEFCECEKPEIINLSLFRPMWACKKCNKDIKDSK